MRIHRIGRPGPALEAAEVLWDRRRMHRRASRVELRAFVAPLLLLALALAQIAGFAAFHLSPWKGGGFGMFSTNDHGGFRSVRVIELSASGERRVALPQALERLERQVREAPQRSSLEHLAAELRRGTQGLGPLRVEVWRTQFSPVDLAPERVLVASAEAP
jgi:hypothetical protein